MRRYFLVLCLAAGVFALRAQPSLFTNLDVGVGGPVLCMQNDTLHGDLYLGGGMFGLLYGPYSPGVVRWDGSQLHTVGCGFEYDCVDTLFGGGLGVPVRDLEQWNGSLFAGGDFDQSLNVYVNHVARWEDPLWQPLQDGLDGPVYSLRALPDGLYAAGWFEARPGWTPI